MSTCTSCKAPVRWARTTTGKATPFDAAPNAAAQWVIADDGIARHAMPLIDDDRSCYMPQWATCPNADQHRSRK